MNKDVVFANRETAPRLIISSFSRKSVMDSKKREDELSYVLRAISLSGLLVATTQRIFIRPSSPNRTKCCTETRVAMEVQMLDVDAPEKAYRLAFDYESKYGTCPQCVIAAVAEVFSLELDELFKASHGLAGGVGLSGSGTCGALSGGIIVLSHLHGRRRKDFAKGRFLLSYLLAKELCDKFTAEFGGCTCREVQTKLFGRPFNLWDAEDFMRFEEAGGHRDKCPAVTGNVAKWVAGILIKSRGVRV